jgi:cell division protein ZapA
MAQLTVRINGFAYPVGCEDGQEPHLLAMAADVDQRIANIKAIGNQTGEARLLVLAALLMADEIHDLKASLATRTDSPPSRRRLSRIAEKAEDLATQIEQAKAEG